MKIYAPVRRRADTFGKHILAACEPLMARLYWHCLSAKSYLDDQRANIEADRGHLKISALQMGRKDHDYRA